MATALGGPGWLYSLRSSISRPGTRLPPIGSDVVLKKQREPLKIKTLSDRLVAAIKNCSWRHRKTAIRTVCWIKRGTRLDAQKTFLCIFGWTDHNILWC